MDFIKITDIDLWMLDIEQLIEKHYQELTLDKDVMTLAPSWSIYRKRIEDGSMVATGIKHDGRLIGYCVWFLSQHLHYEHNTVANNDVLFIDAEHRKGMLGIKFIKYQEQVLQELGVSKVLWHVKLARDFRKILHRMGYHDEDIIVGKALK